jgi:membrane protease subunit HflC
MLNKKLMIWAALAIFGLIVVFSAAFVVTETEQVIITRFGKPVGDPITAPGINFKIPLRVDTYARWRITDPLLFFQRLRDERGAMSRLDDILDGEVRDAIANHDLVEVVRTSNRTYRG